MQPRMPVNPNSRLDAGCEWLIDATGCHAVGFGDAGLLRRLLDAMVGVFDLKPLGSGLWHSFPPPGGVTGMILLSKSHLTIHPWPEFGLAAINLFFCRRRPPWPWDER